MVPIDDSSQVSTRTGAHGGATDRHGRAVRGMTGCSGSPSGRENRRVATTVEIAQRTDRWARFAAVTVEVATTADQTVMVESSADDRDDVRQEAACGARTALRAIPASGHGLRLTVTDIRTVAGETGVGDVHEATARAVWQALGIDPEPAYVGFNEPEVVTAWLRDRIGLRLAAVTEARHWYLARRDPDTESLVHAWLHFNHRPPARLHGHGDDLFLSVGNQYPAYDMDEYGAVHVGPTSAPDLLATAVGRQLTDAAVLLDRKRPSATAALLLDWDTDINMVIGTSGDEWILTTNPSPTDLPANWQAQPWIMRT